MIVEVAVGELRGGGEGGSGGGDCTTEGGEIA